MTRPLFILRAQAGAARAAFGSTDASAIRRAIKRARPGAVLRLTVKKEHRQ